MSTPSATATPEATPPSPPGPRRTGDPALDAIIEAVEAHDVDALLGFVEYQEVPCSEPGEGMGGYPSCEAGEAAGTIVRALPLMDGCEGSWARDARESLRRFALEADGLWAVADVTDYPDWGLWPIPDTLLVFHSVRPGGQEPPTDVAWYLELKDGRILRTAFVCFGPLEGLLDSASGLSVTVMHGPWHEPIEFSGPRRTGDPALDAIIAAVEARDVDALVGMLGTELVECRGPDEPAQIGSPPTCAEAGVSPGSTVTVAWGGGCEGNPSLDYRGLLERWLPMQDGLYAVTEHPREPQSHLIFHGQLALGGSARSLWVRDGEIAFVNFGCGATAEDSVTYGNEALLSGPWPAPLTPRDEAVRTLVAPFLDAIEAGDADPLVEATEQDFLGHGCTTSRDPGAALEAFVDQEPTLVGIYEPEPRGWLPQWWLVFRLSDGAHARLLVDVRPRVDSLFQPCDATLERVTQSGTGDPVPLLWAP